MSFKKNKLSALIAALSGLAGAAAFVSPQVVAQEDAVMEEVVVKGFRQSLEASLNIKRNSANSVESIVAEDIGKMPDLNLAESLQRVPGVAITREGGEGRNITVRGLGPGYTRVTLNGMEVPASTGGLDSSGGVNRSRDFDFNVFGSELFNKIVINKNAIAHVEEGGLASTVELFTMRPLDNEGLTLTGSAQAAYNIHSGEMDPRLTGLFSQTFANDTVGILLGFNRSERTVHQEGFGTVRFTGPASNGDRWWVEGAEPATVTGGTPNPLANYDQATIDADTAANGGTPVNPLNYMWHPRLPRMDSFNRDQTRTGFNAAIEFKPSDEMDFSLTYLKSELEADVLSYNYFAQFRNLQDSIQPTSVVIDPSGRYMVAGTFEGVSPRSESRGQFSNTDFDQIVADFNYEFSDSLHLDVMVGKATADHIEEQYRFNITAATPSSFSYSFENNPNIAEMSYGFDIMDPDNYEWSGPTFRHEEVNRDNSTVKVDLTWEFDENGSNVMAGIISNDREVNSEWWDPINITPSADLPAVSAANTNALSEVVDNFGDGIGGPSGFPTDWLVSDFNASIDAYNAGEFAFDPADSNTYNITEETMGQYVELNYFIGNLQANAGIRRVKTTVTSKSVADDGDGGFIPTVLERDYTKTLPAINLTYEAIPDLLLRAAYSKNIARPGLGNLSGSVTVTPINGQVGFNNPGLDPELATSTDFSAEWYFAEESFVGLTIFRKKITDSITGVEIENTTLPPDLQAIVAARPEYDPSSPLYDPSVLSPTASGWDIETSENSDESDTIDGYELGYQHVLDMGLGFLANYTHVEGDGVVTGLSENSYNLGVFYENEMFGARLMVNDRDDYITSVPGSNGNAEEATTGPTRVDFSGSWNATEELTVTLEIINLTNEKERLYTTGPVGGMNLVREYNTTGTEVLIGARYTF